MRRFHATGAFRSLRYRDMPFVLMPGVWNRLRGAGKAGALQPRAHDDGLLVDFDSPESLEEVFWRVFSGKLYLRPRQLQLADLPEETIERFRAYVGLILASSGFDRYLSKNNNNVLRLPALRQAFPDALLLIPFRDPLAQAESLRRQHRRFLQIHQQDKFALQYMQWLGHHEFGADHRPFVFDDEPRRWTDTERLEYWLESWARCYRYLLQSAPIDSVFVGYESLCDGAIHSWKLLAELAQVDDHLPSTADPLENKNQPIGEMVDRSLQSEAEQLYDELVSRSSRSL